MEEETIYLSLGTNLGNRQQNIICAIEALSRILGNPLSVAPTIETEPWGFSSTNKFLNTVVVFKTTLSPQELLEATQQIERTLGRTAKSTDGAYSDRPIDIDILFYGSRTVNSESLTIPHPLMHQRRFVLEPLAAIAPDMLHPTLNKSVVELLKILEER